MPLLSLFAKIVPESIESSIFALLMGLLNLSFGVFGKGIGNAINWMFFEVDKENLDDLWKLYVVQAVSCLLPLVFIGLLPSREEVNECQEKLKKTDTQLEKEKKTKEAELAEMNLDQDPNAIS